MNPLPPIRAALVGFGEVNSPHDLIERKCVAARQALQHWASIQFDGTVSDDPAGAQAQRARAELAQSRIRRADRVPGGWIPSYAVIDVISPFGPQAGDPVGADRRVRETGGW